MISEAFPVNPVMVVDDEYHIARGYKMLLLESGITNVICCTDSREALKTVQSESLGTVIIDLNMPHVTGEELLEQIVKWQPGIPVIVVTGKDTIESAVACMKSGAHEYLVKPVEADRVVTAVRHALETAELRKETTSLGEKVLSGNLEHPEHFDEIVTRNATMRSIFMYIEAIAGTSHPVLLTGETGAGKELVARAIHRASGRKGQFVAVNAAGLDDTMFADTLFGHSKGAFTGAEKIRVGLVSTAAGGTLFLDEIGELSIPSQVKLLRLLQESEYTPLGEDLPHRSEARVVVATNAKLAELQKEGLFRPDLYFRLNTHKVRIPSLRERLDDLPVLVDHFLENVSEELGKKKPSAPRELMPLLASYSFPGNIRELRALITDAVSRHKSQMLSLAVFKEYIDSAGPVPIADGNGVHSTDPVIFGGCLPQFDQIKAILVDEALKRSSGNQSRAAEIIGTSRQTIRWYLRKDDTEPAS